MTTANRIRQAREAAELSKTALNRIAFGVCNATNVTRLENGQVQTPQAETINRISRALNVSASWLTTGKIGDAERVVRVPQIGQRILAQRIKAGMSARALAAATGLGESAQNIRRLETGAHAPTRATLSRLAAVLDCSPAQLAYGR